MASQRMTFSLPKDLVAKFVRRVPARQRSRYVAQALAAKLSDRDQQLVRACEVANRDRKVRAIVKELDALQDEIAEPWGDATPR
jgi:metal-responsive CopG/Arc/MetJ family transcriptional regulator